MSDPVAAKSTFLCMYMSNHPDTLVSYVKHYGHVKGNVVSAEMKGIDTKGMTLTYKSKQSGEQEHEVRVPFDPPLAGYEEVKPRLLGMKVDAEEALGMMKAPQITSFHLPLRVYQVTLLLSALVYTTFSSPSHPLTAPGAQLRELVGGHQVIKWIWVFTGTVHLLEGAYMGVLCRRYSTPFVVGTLYVLTCTLWGYPIMLDFRRRVHEARIDSIMKGK
ncbi:hypothetical protein NEOLEDRAFT_1083817 [Neolentinus lepideus HHB14362 ss-1]|uniref:DUF2470 domain-containing protein n=1 Tax=Neolentinus lepideus HHB14362 ss-1 TaxID=1314782 RepID=A0A165VRR4_9AGAM|nr:hypothetical protein NEOLEDRAFT_1083817 [Neolentinus lepideus HHB14362 ss-1]